MECMYPVQSGEWESILQSREWSPFLQSFAMGEVYKAIGEEPVRLMVKEGNEVVALCQAIVVPAKRGRHLAVMYGPIIENSKMRKCENAEILRFIVNELKRMAAEHQCSFIRMSPFWRKDDPKVEILRSLRFWSSPLHLLAEHIWYLDLTGKTEEQILMGMRKTTRNLVRRAEKEGVTVSASDDPVRDLPIFFDLYEETRRRHHFVPYPDAFIRAQVEEFSKSDQCRLYIARYKNEPVAASVHMVYGGETSYHHGASSGNHPESYASYLLQWTAIRDALKRGDRVYNFWGIAPSRREEDPFDSAQGKRGKWKVESTRHPFAGVTTFKTGFGGELLELAHCMDLPLAPKYYLTWGFEMVRKWRRGF